MKFFLDDSSGKVKINFSSRFGNTEKEKNVGANYSSLSDKSILS